MASFLKTIKNTIKHWYLPMIIGFIFIGLGIFVFFEPMETYASLVVLFALSFVISGLIETFFALQNRGEIDGWGWHFAGGFFTMLVGFYLLLKPIVTAEMLPYFVGFTVLFRGIQGLGFSFELNNYGSGQTSTLTVMSILGIIFSFFLIANPEITGISLVILTGLSLMSMGLVGISLSIQLKKIKGLPDKISSELKQKIEHLKKEYHQEINK